jgi:hypothetical protein
MTPREAQLYHYFLVPGSAVGSHRKLAKLRVDPAFFERNTVASLKALFDAGAMPDGSIVEAVIDDESLPFSTEEVRQFCERSGSARNGRRLGPSVSQPRPAPFGSMPGRVAAAAGAARAAAPGLKRAWRSLFRL